MQVTISPSIACGSLQAPPSKSAAHRALIAGALSSGCTLEGVSDSKDMEATLGCLQNMGATVKKMGEKVFVGGLDPYNIPSCTLDCGESGSTLRFLIPLCLIGGNKITLVGHGRLMERPLTEYELLCKEKGFLFEKQGNTLTLCGKLTAGDYTLSGERSSQFITGMLYALPLLKGESTLKVTGNAQSVSYLHLSEQVLGDFGIKIENNDLCYRIAGAQKYQRDRFTVEGDWSNAAFPDAFNLLGGDVCVTGLREDSTQGDKIYKEYYQKIGQELDLSDCPDLAPILFALAAVRGGSFVGCRRLRLKESNRISAMQEELAKCGITLLAWEDRVEISPVGLCPPTQPICSHNDHRIVMAMAVLLSKLGGTIEGAEAVSKSWPGFFERIRTLGIEVEIC